MTSTHAEALNSGKPRNVRAALVGRTLVRVAVLGFALLPLPGCQSIVGSPTLSQVRVVDASADAGGLDVYQSGNILAYNLGFGAMTSYIPIAPGNSAIVVNAASTRQELVTASGTFLANGQYTALIGNTASNLQEIILKDQNIAAPAGDISLRIVDQSTRQAGLDLYVIPTGSTIAQVRPILTNVTFGTNTGYLNLPSATYTIVILPTGTTPTTSGTTLYTGAAVAYSASSAQTLVILDNVVITQPSVQVITLTDYDPTA